MQLRCMVSPQKYGRMISHLIPGAISGTLIPFHPDQGAQNPTTDMILNLGWENTWIRESAQAIWDETLVQLSSCRLQLGVVEVFSSGTTPIHTAGLGHCG